MQSSGKIQITLIQVDGYGPWTEKLGFDREHKIQVFQANLYLDIQMFFAEKGGLVFPVRFDNMLAVTNGITLEVHREIQRKIREKHCVTVSMGIGSGETAYEAQEKASKNLIRHMEASVSPQPMILAPLEKSSNCGVVQMAHFDVNSSIKLVTNKFSAYEAYGIMRKVHSVLMKRLERKGGLVFFCGGDNFISPSNGVTKEDYLEAVDAVHRETGLKLRVGVGIGYNAKHALRLANEGLDGMRAGIYANPVRISPETKNIVID